MPFRGDTSKLEIPYMCFKKNTPQFYNKMKDSIAELKVY